jgi:gamma-glutamyl phosphate reductase
MSDLLARVTALALAAKKASRALALAPTAVRDQALRAAAAALRADEAAILQTVANSIDQAETRTRQMSRQLRAVEALPGVGDEAGGAGGVAWLLDGVAPE